VSDLNVYEPKFSSMRTLRAELKQPNVRFVDLNYVQANSQ